ncbi:cytochrome c oxidase accessory protein CcoG [Telmatospirillum sp. J64-1]|uniref:cytochrome c oxidase accessory protein CcoG n=1 Tax=Telmatospirillum sp. J64-1 TaxID=2502183 RepID=UPI00115C7A90|nr:cytochrome c oxidase accessory protein CcoG [Telmatospirillum sp. J64-1]
MATVKEAAVGSSPASSKKPEEPEKVPLYAYEKVYPRTVKGRFRSMKTVLVGVLLALYYLVPFLRWDRGPDAPDQAVLIDMVGRRAYFFMIEIWPQEVYYLTGLLIMGAIGLFLATALLGRVWCGFTCPQTVWTDLFIWVERKFEGDRNERIKLDRQPWNANKLLRKLGKHSVWMVIALLTGGAFVLYFNDAMTVIGEIVTGQAGWGVYTFLAIFTSTTYLLAGWAREQVCLYMCPWPRFQAAMVDEHSMIVTYEEWRGEPRGFAKKDTGFEGRGHCVDCRMCVQVCPTGIDIREGSQMGCIGCGLCIDACNSVMDRFNLPRDLIRFDSATNQLAREQGRPVAKVKWVRPRTVAYAVLLLVVGSLMAFVLATRDTTEVSIQHERSPLYVQLSDGNIRNAYTYKILNMVREERVYTLRVKNLEGATVSVIGIDSPDSPDAAIRLPVNPDTIGNFRIYVTAPPSALNGRTTDLYFELTDPDGHSTLSKSLFAGPRQ